MSIERGVSAWSFETDVVVIGGGGCGLTAAIAAAQAGVEVFVLEKQQRPWSNTARSGGMIPAAGTRLQKAAGINESSEDFAKDIFHKNGNTSAQEMTHLITRTATEMVDWLINDVGVNLTFIDDFKYPGHSELRMHAPPNRTGAALAADLRRAAEAQPHVEPIDDAAALGLVVDDHDSVVGVIVKRGDGRERVRCQKVILACNGFAGNAEMVAKYCPAIANALYFGGEGNTGEGILWGLELGAAVEFMDAYQAHASVATPHNILITYAIITEGGFMVNRQGARFGNESTGYSEYALDVLAQPDGVAFDIYDERLHQLGLTFDDYKRALDADAIYHADTIEDLATKLGVDASGLAKTLADYHAAADEDRPDAFGRNDCARLEPPYYGVKVSGALFHTQGGLKVDQHARVLREDGKPIPNLYAGGGVAAGLSGHGPGGYLSGNGLLTALGFGMLAGRHAARSIQEQRS